jgi:hypothetical protein
MTRIVKILVPIFVLMLLMVIGCAKKPPIMTGITPNSGPTGGGTQFRIAGENFKVGATVTIGGKPLLNMSINTEGTQVTGTTPGSTPGPKQVISTNLKAKEPSLPLTFNYEELRVVNTTPIDGTELPIDPRVNQVSASFSQDIDPTSVSISMPEIAGQSNYDQATKTVTFTAEKVFKTGTSFTATVSGAKDMAGNVMPDLTFGFSIQKPQEKVEWYTVQEGDTLEIIAAKPEVYEDENQANFIFLANQDEFVSPDGKHGNDVINDRRRLKPGMTLYIPR